MRYYSYMALSSNGNMLNLCKLNCYFPVLRHLPMGSRVSWGWRRRWTRMWGKAVGPALG